MPDPSDVPAREYILRALGPSICNYVDLYEERFIHYCRICRMILQSGARRVLEIGPGDHTVTDFLRRKGVEVWTLDNDPALFPDYMRDVRHPWDLDRRFDAILAAEVFEHLPFKQLDGIAEQAAEYLAEDGLLFVSLPYSTVRLFPKDKRYGTFQSPMGRLPTGIPISAVQRLVTIVRGIYRFFILRYTWKGSFRYFQMHPPDDQSVSSVHHWDVGYHPTSAKVVRAVFEKRFRILHEFSDWSVMNIRYYIMRKLRAGEKAGAPEQG